MMCRRGRINCNALPGSDAKHQKRAESALAADHRRQMLPFPLINDTERQIAADPEWQAGLRYGVPRPGHPEGAVLWHVRDVLDNVERLYGDSPWRERLRLIALVHDAFKYRVDPQRPRRGDNHHATHARRFAERHISAPAVLDVIELHDEAYNAWQCGHRDSDWQRAEERAAALLDRLGDTLELYLAFYRCDNATGDKSKEPFLWFLDLIRRRDDRNTA